MVLANNRSEMCRETQPLTAMSVYRMTDDEFDTLRDLIFVHSGIDIRPHKKQLLVNRLAKRLRNLGLTTFSQYLHYLKNGRNRDHEVVEFIDAVTTNKTDFYREPKHFSFLESQVIPEFVRNHRGGNRCLRFWSAACSSGEEPYTLAIVLSETLAKYPGWSFEIQASDLCETILRQAMTGIYEEQKVQPIPHGLLRKYFLRGNGRYKVKPELQRNIQFRKLNLMHGFDLALSGFDAIFLRNVLIYFNKEIQTGIIERCWNVLRPGGYLFLGHSETLQGMITQFRYVIPSVYRKPTES